VVGLAIGLNSVVYKDRVYRTLGETSPFNTGHRSKSQNYWLPLPPGWTLAGDSEDSRYVIGSYYWEYQSVLLTNGKACRTNCCGVFAIYDQCSTDDDNLQLYVSTSGTLYAKCSKNGQILISKSVSDMCTGCPAGELEIPPQTPCKYYFGG
jgi:hypothetical protein